MKLDQPVIDYCRRYVINNPKHRLIIQYMMEGLIQEKIGEELGMSKEVINSTTSYLYKKTGVTGGRTEIMSEIYKDTLRQLEDSQNGKKIEQIRKILG